VQSDYAGIDHIAGHAIVNSDVKVSTLSGVTASVVAEYVVMSMLSLGHKLPLMMADKSAKIWEEDKWKKFTPFELRGSTVGVVGYGSVGRQVASREPAILMRNLRTEFILRKQLGRCQSCVISLSLPSH
jgi:phosphoglycerate dehydrogenase-like enzyme